MSLKFKIKKKVMGIGKKKGQVVFYAHQENHERLSVRHLEERIMRQTSLSRADVHSALIAFGEVVTEEVSAGRAVDLGPLGMIKIVASSKMMSSRKEVTAATVNKPKLVYVPKQEMKAAAEGVSINVERPTKKKGDGEPEEEEAEVPKGGKKDSKGSEGGVPF